MTAADPLAHLKPDLANRLREASRAKASDEPDVVERLLLPIRNDPEVAVAANFGLAWATHRLGQHRRFLAYRARAEFLAGRQDEFHFFAGMGLEATRQLRAAERAFQAALTANPKHPAACKALARVQRDRLRLSRGNAR